MASMVRSFYRAPPPTPTTPCHPPQHIVVPAEAEPAPAKAGEPRPPPLMVSPSNHHPERIEGPLVVSLSSHILAKAGIQGRGGAYHPPLPQGEGWGEGARSW